MDSLVYNIVLKTPIGYRVGTLTIEITDRIVQGIIHILGRNGQYCGTIDNNGEIIVSGELPTHENIVPFSGNGKISSYAIHLSAVSGEKRYELDGTSQK